MSGDDLRAAAGSSSSPHCNCQCGGVRVTAACGHIKQPARSGHARVNGIMRDATSGCIEAREEHRFAADVDTSICNEGTSSEKITHKINLE